MSEQHPGKAALNAMIAGTFKHTPAGFIGSPEREYVVSIASYVSTLEARLEKAEAERDAAKVKGDEIFKRLQQWMALTATARNDALEEAAKDADCECKGRDVVLSPNVRSNSPERWEACGEANCCALTALDIRLLKSPS